MSKQRKPPPPIYQPPKRVPATAENLKSWRDAVNRHFRTPVDRQFENLLTGVRQEIRDHLVGLGVTFKSSSASFPPPRAPHRAIVNAGDDVAAYIDHEAPPEVEPSLEVLRLVHDVSTSSGAHQLMSAINLGRALEQVRVEWALAGPLDSHRRGRAKPHTPDAVIAKRVAARRPGERWVDIAAELGISERTLRERRQRMK